VLASGRAESRFAAAKVDDALNEGGLLEAAARPAPRRSTASGSSGDLALLTQGERHNLTADSADQGYVRAFFKACGS
jgi:hypothetical protein